MNDAEISEKLNAILKILQDFGLNVIQHLGEVKKALTVLTDKIDGLSKATIDLKSLGNRLGEVIRSNDRIAGDLALVKKLVKNQAGNSMNIAHDKVETSAGNGSPPPDAGGGTGGGNDPLFVKTRSLVKVSKNLREIRNGLTTLQEQLFEERGPSALLSEIRKFANFLKVQEELTEDIRIQVLKKLDDWENRAL
ncbi:MAG: hypothetical protein ACTSU5_07970 [Promethearchaeota archaeon]